MGLKLIYPNQYPTFPRPLIRVVCTKKREVYFSKPRGGGWRLGELLVQKVERIGDVVGRWRRSLV